MTVRSKSGRRSAAGKAGRILRWPLALGLILLVVVPLLAALLLVCLPAATLAPAVAALSRDQVRFAVPAGRLNSGRGELWVRGAAGRDWRPWMPVDWQLSPVWNEAGPALVLATNFADLRLDRAGLTVNRVRIQVPPEFLVQAVNHPLANAPWRGDIELTAGALRCPWSGLRRSMPACDGQARLHWQGMASSIVPIPELGSFVATISAESRSGGRWRAALSTEQGVIAVSGYAELRNGLLDYRIGINGAAGLLADLDNVVGVGGHRRGDAGEFILENVR